MGISSLWEGEGYWVEGGGGVEEGRGREGRGIFEWEGGGGDIGMGMEDVT